jgi:hypothetical protein
MCYSQPLRLLVADILHVANILPVVNRVALRPRLFEDPLLLNIMSSLLFVSSPAVSIFILTNRSAVVALIYVFLLPFPC